MFCISYRMEVGEDGWALRMPTGKNLGSLDVVHGEGERNRVNWEQGRGPPAQNFLYPRILVL